MTAVLEIQGRGRTAFCRPVQSFSQVARQVGMKDEDGLRFAVSSRPGFLAVPPPGPTGAPDACEHCESLEADILERIPENISEMYVEAMILRIPPHTIR